MRATALLDFSYAGGAARRTGRGCRTPYPCELTDRPSDENLAPLETMLRDYGAHHPNAHFTLVGHSLGGYLAFLEGAREAGRTKAAKLGIDAVVTLDAPLQGASPDKKLMLDIVPCDKTYLAGAEIVGAEAGSGDAERAGGADAGDGRRRHPACDVRQLARLLLESGGLRAGAAVGG